MIRRPPRSTLTDTLFPYTTLCRSNPGSSPMRIISFNANGVRSAARKGFFDWFATQDADLLCMQETKAQEHQLAGTDGLHADFLPAGYKAWFRDATTKKGYSRSEEHTSELQSLMRISYAVFCLKK